MVVAKCLKLIWNHSGIISGTHFSKFQGFSDLYVGLRRAPKPKPYFGSLNNFLHFLWMNNSIDYCGLNQWKKWIFKTDWPGLVKGVIIALGVAVKCPMTEIAIPKKGGLCPKKYQNFGANISIFWPGRSQRPSQFLP